MSSLTRGEMVSGITCDGVASRTQGSTVGAPRVFRIQMSFDVGGA